MRLAISNIAWDVVNDDEIAALLKRYRIDAIDIAPSKYFPNPAQARDDEIDRVKTWWAGQGIEITGMQSLLYGTQGLNLFGSAEVRAEMLAHLGGVCRLGGRLGATRLVFGSPRNRDRSGLHDAEALGTAIQFFRDLGEIAAAEGVYVCLEPNPARYGANFMTGTEETASVVEAVGHPAIKLQLDSGAMTVNGENPAALIPRFCHRVGHVHASEPDLVPLGDGGTDHAAMGAALRAYLPTHLVCIEMLATPRERQLAMIEQALGVAARAYRSTNEATLP
ncbi:MAG: sugar phosphate isomerase/epimerase family protein [Thiotrichales bacterium]